PRRGSIRPPTAISPRLCDPAGVSDWSFDDRASGPGRQELLVRFQRIPSKCSASAKWAIQTVLHHKRTAASTITFALTAGKPSANPRTARKAALVSSSTACGSGWRTPVWQGTQFERGPETKYADHPRSVRQFVPEALERLTVPRGDLIPVQRPEDFGR